MQALRTLASSTAFRWALAIAGAFTAILLLLSAFIYWQTAAREQDGIDAMVLVALRYIADGPVEDVVPRLGSWLANDPHGLRYGALFGPDGRRISGNILVLPTGLTADRMAHRADVGPISRDTDGDKIEAVRGAAARLNDGRLIALGYDMDELDQVRDAILRALALGLLPSILLSLAGGMVLARRAQHRITAVYDALERITHGQLQERLPSRGTFDELDKVAAAVNRMLDRIELLVGEIRGVGDNIAHDLRTPLTRVRTRLERSRDEARTREEFQLAADRAIASVDEALGVVSAVLRIGEIEHGRRCAAFTAIDPAGLVRDVAELYEPVAEERGSGIQLDLAPTDPICGDRDLLLEALGNLVDNAIKFSPAGTAITLSLSARSDGASIRVADRGSGIPVAERERVLQRFYRVEKSRTVVGSGLGLSLVAAVVTLHGFRLQIGEGAPGCVIEILCPFIRPTTTLKHDAPPGHRRGVVPDSPRNRPSGQEAHRSGLD